jgi:hypothetical protein
VKATIGFASGLLLWGYVVLVGHKKRFFSSR